MESYALLVAATLNAGTVLALAALGLLINEKAGVLNLGAEGMMLCAAIAGFAAVIHTGNDWIGFAAGMGAGAVIRIRIAALQRPFAGHAQFTQHVQHVVALRFGIGMSDVADMDDDVGRQHFLQRRTKGRDQLGRQVGDEADRVGQDRLVQPR